MPRPRHLLFASFLLLAAAGGYVEDRHVQRQQDELDVHAAQIARLETAVHSERERLARAQAEHESIEREIAAGRAAAADAEARSTMKLWANRIALLRQLIEEMPAQSLPEFRLLTATDWVQVVRNRELDTPNNIRAAFSSLRATARRKMAEKFQEALKHYTAGSAGELPFSIELLEPHLTAPADREMLQRYALLRSGRIDDRDEYVIKEITPSDMILSVGIQTWNVSLNSDWAAPADESETAALARATSTLEAIFEQVDPTGGSLPTLFKAEIFREMMERLTPQMDAMFGDRFGDELTAAVKRFGAERDGAAPTDLGQLAPYLVNFHQLITVARPVLAELEYMRDHFGQRHTDPAQLQRYLEKPLDQLTILRELKLTTDGDRVTMKFEFSTN
jgi:hypothetical protein